MHTSPATHTGRDTHEHTHTNQQASVKTVVRDVIVCSLYKSSIGGSVCLSTFELLSVYVCVYVCGCECLALGVSGCMFMYVCVCLH